MKPTQNETQAQKEQRQMALELNQVDLGVAKARAEVERAKQHGSYATTRAGTTILYQLMQPYAKALVDFVTDARCASDKELAAFIIKCRLDRVAFIVLRSILTHIGSGSNKLTTFAKIVAEALLNDLNITEFKETEGYERFVMDSCIKAARRQQGKSRLKSKLYEAMLDKGIEHTTLETEQRVQYGFKLTMIFAKATGLVRLVKLRQHKHEAYCVVATEELLGYIEMVEGECELLNPVLYPMIVPPKNHRKGGYGGYLSGIEHLRSPLVKDARRVNKKYLDDYEMPKVYKAINTIQQTAWQINSRVLAVLQHYVELGIGIDELDLPDASEIPLPPNPAGSKRLSKAEWIEFKNANKETLNAYQIACADIHQKNAANRSKRLLYKSLVSVANKFKDEPELYYCYELDWRGRVYPVQSGHIPNPQGLDASKALLHFATAKPLGIDGDKWLSLHGANCFGDDKTSLEYRFNWAYEHQRQILEVASDPFEYKWWWEADSPWKFLAFCYEWAEFFNSGYTAEFKSRIPVALDGTCSGIQHFSALLLDKRGAMATNVTNGNTDIPSDIYGEVAKVTASIVHKDALAGVPQAKVCDGKIDRSVTKRNTMTTPYGVTRRGMIDQLASELTPEEWRSDECGFFSVASYLGGVNMQAIGEVVVASRVAMQWLKDMAKAMTKANKVFHWTVPSGFVVNQVYKKPKTKKVNTFWGGSRIRLDIDEDSELINHKKVVQGQAPNYIHSMDAAHLMLSVLRASEYGVGNFGLIHDSFATHAGDTAMLLQALKECFVEMYSVDNLERFMAEIKSQMPAELYDTLPPVPPRGNLDINEVFKSNYIFS